MEADAVSEASQCPSLSAREEDLDCVPNVMGSCHKRARPDSGFKLTPDVSGK